MEFMITANRGKTVLNGRKAFVLLIAVLFITTGCLDRADKQNRIIEQPDKPVVFTSIYPMYDFTKNIGGDRIDLRMAIPAGAEPHDWEPTAKLLAALQEADIFIYNGVGMEPWVDDMLASLSGDGPFIVEASEGIGLLKLENHVGKQSRHHNGFTGYDPHVWLDPVRANMQCENILSALIKVDQRNEDYYRSNFLKFSDKLKELDNLYRETLSGFSRREIVVSHAAFGYLADRYGLIQIAVSGLNPREEPSAAELVELTQFIREKGVRHILFETLTSPKLAEVLAIEAGAKIGVLNPIGGLTRQEMDEGMDYLSVMMKNLETLKDVLAE
jgi:zinc transport system substrate-binding protein